MINRNNPPKSATESSNQSKKAKRAGKGKARPIEEAQAPKEPSRTPLPILPNTKFDYKDEKLQIKAAITFFALRCVGCLAKFYMLRSYERDGAFYELSVNERVLFEGIFIASSLATGEVILKMVEELIVNTENSVRRSINIYTTQNIHLSLANVAWIEFSSLDENFDQQKHCLNISRDGFSKTERVLVTPYESLASPSAQTIASTEATSVSSISKLEDAVQSTLIDSSSTLDWSTIKIGGPPQKNQQQSKPTVQKKTAPEVQQNQTAKPQQNKKSQKSALQAVQQTQDLQPKSVERKLVKYNVSSTNKSSPLQNIQETGEDQKPFNQFAGKVSSYDFNNYTTKIDESKITQEQIVQASKLEQQLTKSKTLTKFEQDGGEMPDEEMLHSAVERPQFQQNLAAHLQADIQHGDEAVQRPRINSLRDADGTKVIKQLDLQYPTLDKGVVQEFMKFKKVNEQGLMQDRRLSSEYFKDESKRLEAVIHSKIQMQQPIRKFTCFNSIVSQSISESFSTAVYMNPSSQEQFVLEF